MYPCIVLHAKCPPRTSHTSHTWCGRGLAAHHQLHLLKQLQQRFTLPPCLLARRACSPCLWLTCVAATSVAPVPATPAVPTASAAVVAPPAASSTAVGYTSSLASEPCATAAVQLLITLALMCPSLLGWALGTAAPCARPRTTQALAIQRAVATAPTIGVLLQQLLEVWSWRC